MFRLPEDWSAAAIAEALDRDGVVCLPAAVDDDSLTELRAEVDRRLAGAARGKSFSVVQPQAEGGEFGRLAADPAFNRLLADLAAHAVPGRHFSEALYNVLRVIVGAENTAKSSLVMHYDHTAITALVPIEIPDGTPEEAGDLVCFPNWRPIRRSVAVNLFDKLLVQNDMTRALFARWARRRTGRAKIVRLVPGNIYLFWGYRTVHGNFECGVGKRRATLLYHYGNPHDGSSVTDAIRRVRSWRVDRELARA